MSGLRDLCRCAHVRGSHHDDGACVNAACGCDGWRPAYPVYDTVLPVGVEPRTFFTGTGLTIVECHHRLPRLHSWCPFCFAEARATDGFAVPVQRLVFAPTELRLL